MTPAPRLPPAPAPRRRRPVAGPGDLPGKRLPGRDRRRSRGRHQEARRRTGQGSVARPRRSHRDRRVGEQEREEAREDALGKEKRDEAAKQRAGRREHLEEHPQAQVRQVALQVDPGRRAAGHDHADQADPDRLAEWHAEADREERDDEDPAPQAQQRPEDAGAEAAGGRGGARRSPCGRPVGAPAGRSGPEVLRRVRQQRHVACPLQRDRQLALVRGAGPGLAPRLDLRPLGEVAAEAADLLVVDLRRSCRRRRRRPCGAVDRGSSRRASWMRAGGIGSRCSSEDSSEGEVVEVGGGVVRAPNGAADRRRWAPVGASAGSGGANPPSPSSRGRRSRLVTWLAISSVVYRFWPCWSSHCAGLEAAFDVDLHALAKVLGGPLAELRPRPRRGTTRSLPASCRSWPL